MAGMFPEGPAPAPDLLVLMPCRQLGESPERVRRVNYWFWPYSIIRGVKASAARVGPG